MQRIVSICLPVIFWLALGFGWGCFYSVSSTGDGQSSLTKAEAIAILRETRLTHQYILDTKTFNSVVGDRAHQEKWVMRYKQLEEYIERMTYEGN